MGYDRKEYQRLRTKHPYPWAALGAYRAAQVKWEWEEFRFKGELVVGCVALRVVQDQHNAWDPGDMYNPKANPDIPPKKLQAQYEAEKKRVEGEGMTGIIGEYWDGNHWKHADSCFGFVGEDWIDSGCDTDIKRVTLACAEAVRDEHVLVSAIREYQNHKEHYEQLQLSRGVQGRQGTR